MDYVSSKTVFQYTNHVVGYCSLCGGEVTQVNVWYGTQPPDRTCSNCGATERKSLPIITMEKPVKTITTNKTTICGPYCDWPYCNCENYK